MRLLRRLVPTLLLLGLAGRAGAQTVTGSVIDSATRAPMAAVTILLVDATDSLNRRAVVTDTAGRFRIAAPKPGTYLLFARRLGFLPIGAPARRLDSGSVRSIRFEMMRLPTMLDTVRAKARMHIGALSRLTTGQEWFSKHYREGKGFFTSGNEILLSRLNACDFLGQVPGLTLSGVSPMAGESGLRCQDGRYIVTAHRPSCFRTIIDRKWTIAQVDSTTILVRTLEADNLAYQIRTDMTGQMWTQAGDTLGSPFPVAQLAGIEVFRNRSELPDDFSIPMDMGPAPTVRNQTSSQRISTGAVVPMVKESSMQCAYVLIWTRSFW